MTKRIALDPGHGGRDPGAIGHGLREKDLVLNHALLARELLESRYEVRVTMTRTTDIYLSLAERARIANNAGADGFVSWHVNAAASASANGVETFIHSSRPPRTVERGRLFHAQAGQPWVNMRRADRGLKDANFAVLRQTQMSAVLLESGFITNARDAELLRDPGFTAALVEGAVKGIADAFNLPKRNQAPAPGPDPAPSGTPIVGEPSTTFEHAQGWARARGAHERFVEIAPVYWGWGEQTGIRPEVAYCQAAKETAFGRYGGAVDPAQNNWAGIKTATATGDRPEDHDTFATPGDGVRAHFNHLAAYVGKAPQGEPHGRYHVVKALDWAGTIETVEELGGKWAPRSDYGESIVKEYLVDLLRAAPPYTPNNYAARDIRSHWALEALEWALDEDNRILTVDGAGNVRPDDPVTRAELAVVARRLVARLEQTTEGG